MKGYHNMKKTQRKLGVNFIIAVIIISGFMTMGIINYTNYSEIIKNDIQNISKLTSSNIYSKINNEIIKPIFVSLTMANDAFLKDWIKSEGNNDSQKLINYLQGIKDKYHYNSVFLVSERTRNYYHFDGKHKRVSSEDDHDVWYFNFINSEETYDLDVDFDEAADKQLTVFVNCKISDSQGRLIGVTGVGVKMNSIQHVLRDYEEKYNLEAFLIDKNGLVQVHTDSSKIEAYNIFDNKELYQLKDKILKNEDNSLSFNIKDKILQGYYISRYIEELDWHLIVKKDTKVLAKSFLKQWVKDAAILLAVVVIVLIIVTRLINKFKKQLTHMAEVDQLTGIYNRRVFDEVLNKTILSAGQKKKTFAVIVLDIDQFKIINDTYGHIFGDRIIKAVSHLIDEQLQRPDIVSRWGGDEFACIMFGQPNDIIKKVEKIQTVIYENELLNKHNITLSIGIANYLQSDNLTSIVRRADEGLYYSKRNGRNQFKVWEEAEANT